MIAVVPPRSRLISMPLTLVLQAPPVKSGTETELKLLATDHSLSGPTELQRAASYTFISRGSPLRRQSIRRQSMIVSIPPCPPTCRASSPTRRVISGVNCSSRSRNSSSETSHHGWWQFLQAQATSERSPPSRSPDEYANRVVVNWYHAAA